MNIRRRAIDKGACALLLCAISVPARPAGARRIGLLSVTETYTKLPEWRAFVDELARLGHVQGRNLEYLHRYAGTYDEPQMSRVLMAAAAELVGEPAGEAAFKQAASIVLRDAKGLAHNAFKIDLARRAIVRALTQAANGTPQIQANKKIR